MPKHSTSIGLIAFAGTLVVGAAGFAFAQGAQAPTGKRAVAQAAPAQPPVAATAPAPSPPREWTGESGSSGHPLMQATAIRQAAANFEQCLEGLWPLAQKRGVSRATYRQACRRPHARPPHHGPDGRAAGVHQGVLGLSRHPGARSAHRRRPRAARQIQAGVRSGREGLWRRPPHRHVDLGCGVELRHHGRRAPGDPLDCDACLRRAAAGLFPRRVSGHPRNPASQRRAPGATQGLVGRCVRADPVHADFVQALRRGLRRRRPPRRRRTRFPI